jgi:hypothetical protein
MALYTTTTDVSGILPDASGPLIVQPALAASIFAQVATTVTTCSHSYRIPIETADPAAAWVAEGAEITPSDPTLAELTVTPPRVPGQVRSPACWRSPRRSPPSASGASPPFSSGYRSEAWPRFSPGES